MTIRVLLLAVVGLLSSPAAFAQTAPYDDGPEIKPPYHQVRYDASTEPGELIFPASYTVWLPPGGGTLRGVIVHQHGCGVGSCRSGLTGAFDLHWQALAREHRCALLAPVYEQPDGADCRMWCDPRNGSGERFRQALRDLAGRSGRPELADAPWALWGHSGGGVWAGGMTLLHPDRVAAVWLRSGVPGLEPDADRPGAVPFDLPPAALRVPMICNLGAKEGVTATDGRFARVWPANRAFFEAVRGEGGLIATAIDPLTAHECGNQRYLAIPWFDVCLSARLPEEPGRPLRPMPTDGARLADLRGSDAIPAAEYEGDPHGANWLPNGPTARRWAEYVRDADVADATPPPAPTNVRIEGGRLRWDAVADLESGMSHFLIERNGERIAQVPPAPRNPFGRPLFQGLQYSDTPAQPSARMEYVLPEGSQHTKATFAVRAVNTIGLTSGPSE